MFVVAIRQIRTNVSSGRWFGVLNDIEVTGSRSAVLDFGVPAMVRCS